MQSVPRKRKKVEIVGTLEYSAIMTKIDILLRTVRLCGYVEGK